MTPIGGTGAGMTGGLSGVTTIPADTDFTDQGQMFAPGASAEWDSYWNDCVVPASIVELNGDWYCYYTGSEGQRSSDVGPAARAVGVVVNTGDPADPADWSKSGSNPIITHQPNNVEEEGVFYVCAEEKDGTVHLYAEELTDAGTGSVNGDVGYYTSTDGVSFTRQSTVLAHDNTSVTGYGDELEPFSITHDGSDWYLHYRASNPSDLSDEQLCVAWHSDPGSLATNTSTFFNATASAHPREMDAGKPIDLGDGDAVFPITTGDYQMVDTTKNTATVRRQPLSDLTTVGSESLVWDIADHHMSTLHKADEWLLPVGIYTSGDNPDDVHLFTAPIA